MKRLITSLRRIPGVLGTAYGFPYIDKTIIKSEKAILVFVDKKKPLSKVPHHFRIPQKHKLEGGNSLRVDVLEASEFISTYAENSSKNNFSRKLTRPARAGCSFGLSNRVGTLGLVVCPSSDPQNFLILSSAHVLNYKFDNREYLLYQPSGPDKVSGKSLIAKAIKYTRLSLRQYNHTEAALAKPFDKNDLDPFHPFGPLNGICEEPFLGQKVRKIGRTTGEVSGEVVATNWEGLVKIGNKKYPFARQIMIVNNEEPISLFGDSGSVWIDDEMKVVGLNFAGSNSGKISLNSSAKKIFQLFDITLTNQN